ncbi:hypothetical protein PG997_005773 [Apiospora hydei]|uniref:Uncharacterized protein n=1 Tax=Apiospora hydei TaxID=1337664 RepID=A0ABR1WNA6_9PEZI
MALQYQFGVVEASETFRKAVVELLKACSAEDIQPLVFETLEAFGHWLMVDPTRLSDGEKALLGVPNSQRQFHDVIVGHQGQLLPKIVRENMHLTAAFIFIAGCTVLNAQRTGNLIHEVMRLQSNISIAPHQVTLVVERMKGYRDYLTQTSPFDVYD